MTLCELMSISTIHYPEQKAVIIDYLHHLIESDVAAMERG